MINTYFISQAKKIEAFKTNWLEGLKKLEKLLEQNGGGNGFFVGNEVT